MITKRVILMTAAAVLYASAAFAVVNIVGPGDLVIDPTATWDVTNNQIIYLAHGSAGLTTITGYLSTGYNNGGLLDWNGKGISSSTASTDGRFLGSFLNDNGAGGTIQPTFFGNPVTNADVLVRYTYAGDTNLDGSVGSADYVNLLGSLGSPGTWINGDIDYNGTVGSSDVVLLLGNLGNPPLGSSLGAGGITPVFLSIPEPSTFALLALGLFCLYVYKRKA